MQENISYSLVMENIHNILNSKRQHIKYLINICNSVTILS